MSTCDGSPNEYGFCPRCLRDGHDGSERESFGNFLGWTFSGAPRPAAGISWDNIIAVFLWILSFFVSAFKAQAAPTAAGPRAPSTRSQQPARPAGPIDLLRPQTTSPASASTRRTPTAPNREIPIHELHTPGNQEHAGGVRAASSPGARPPASHAPGTVLGPNQTIAPDLHGAAPQVHELPQVPEHDELLAHVQAQQSELAEEHAPEPAPPLLDAQGRPDLGTPVVEEQKPTLGARIVKALGVHSGR